jgi:hypothetical protein
MSQPLATAISAQPEQNSIRVGEIATVSPLTVAFQGGTPIPCGILDGVAVEVGQPVAVGRQGATWLVLGGTASYTVGAVANANGARTSPTGTVNSTSFVNIPNHSFVFRKGIGTSKLRLNFEGSFFTANGASSGLDLGVSITGTTEDGGSYSSGDIFVATLRATMVTNSHTTIAGFLYQTGVPAGLYVIQGRWRAQAVITITSDLNDFLCSEAMEATP